MSLSAFWLSMTTAPGPKTPIPMAITITGLAEVEAGKAAAALAGATAAVTPAVKGLAVSGLPVETGMGMGMGITLPYDCGIRSGPSNPQQSAQATCIISAEAK